MHLLREIIIRIAFLVPTTRDRAVNFQTRDSVGPRQASPYRYYIEIRKTYLQLRWQQLHLERNRPHALLRQSRCSRAGSWIISSRRVASRRAEILLSHVLRTRIFMKITRLDEPIPRWK